MSTALCTGTCTCTCMNQTNSIGMMSDSINCNFARCAVQRSMQTHMKTNKLPKGAMPHILRNYNGIFSSVPALQVTHKIAATKFLPILRLFNKKWHPQEMRTAYITTFSLHNWKELSEEETNAHTVRNCTACYEKFATFSAAFPTPKRRGKKPLLPPKTTNIQFLEQDLSSTNALGRKVLRELNTISQERFQTPGNVETPKSNLAHKPTSHEKRKTKRTIERSMKNAIVKQKEEQASELVLQNRISWRTYDRLRKAEGLETCSSRKRLAERISDGEPRNKRRCTSLLNNTMVDNVTRGTIMAISQSDKLVTASQRLRTSMWSDNKGILV